jgi:CBS-domain-containing membrane protein
VEQGAAAVLQFYTIEAPLAQPRNSVGGQIISVVIGVCISKLFEMSPHYESIRWVGGAIACATATAAMALTKTVHPPAGATALLAVVDRTAASLGWRLIAVVIVGSLVMMGTALLVNNIQNKFPMYWWTAENLRSEKPDVIQEKEDVDVEGRNVTATSSDEESLTDVDADDAAEIVLRKGKLIIRGNVSLSPEEKELLEVISERL